LQDQLADPHAPVVLRLELGKTLQTHQELAGSLLQGLLDPANPAPLRLIACETILSDASIQGPERAGAEAALRDLARLPNREISLTTADIVKRRLGVDLGMGMGQPLPPVHSRQAADISRRVTHWANQAVAAEELENSRLPAAS
ncbi:MAG: hypothetical protein ACREYE_25805, partial [Gammaproteobacteria bacterium]